MKIAKETTLGFFAFAAPWFLVMLFFSSAYKGFGIEDAAIEVAAAFLGFLAAHLFLTRGMKRDTLRTSGVTRTFLLGWVSVLFAGASSYVDHDNLRLAVFAPGSPWMRTTLIACVLLEFGLVLAWSVYWSLEVEHAGKRLPS